MAFDGSTQKKTDGKALVPEVVSAVLGSKALRQATRPLGQNERESLSRAIQMDVDEWRAEFASQLRQTAQELLVITKRDLELIKPDSRAYTLAVLIDKSGSLEGRNQLNTASVNIQVNNFGPASKDTLLDQLEGRAMGNVLAATVVEQGNRETDPTAQQQLSNG